MPQPACISNPVARRAGDWQSRVLALQVLRRWLDETKDLNCLGKTLKACLDRDCPQSTTGADQEELLAALACCRGHPHVPKLT